MLLVLLIAVLSQVFFSWNIQSALMPVVSIAHHTCVSLYSGHTLKAIAGALVCGAELTDSTLKKTFVDLGVYHVLVVSGAHLTLLANFLSSLFERASGYHKIFLATVLFTYALITRLEPPVVRALIHMGLLFLAARRSAGPVDILFSYFYSLAFCPTWIHSLSLHLSTGASLMVSLSSKRLIQHLLIYAVLFPMLLALNAPAPITIVTGFLLSPVLELALFPFCVALAALPALQSTAEPLLNVFLRFLTELQLSLRSESISAPLRARGWLPFYFLILWLGVSFQKQNRQQNWFFCRNRKTQ